MCKVALPTVHILMMALAASRFGIPIREISIGIGPAIFSVGRVRVRSFPLGGFVKLKDSRAEPLDPSDTADAFDHQPAWVQVVTPMAGPAFLLMLCLSILGAEGWRSFVDAFVQIFRGALFPLSEGKEYLQEFVVFLQQRNLLEVFGLAAGKLAALNLLPLPSMNGGQALLAVLRQGRTSLSWETRANNLFSWLLFGLLVGWSTALVNCFLA